LVFFSHVSYSFNHLLPRQGSLLLSKALLAQKVPSASKESQAKKALPVSRALLAKKALPANEVPVVRMVPAAIRGILEREGQQEQWDLLE
jgi:hypothetical protein